MSSHNHHDLISIADRRSHAYKAKGNPASTFVKVAHGTAMLQRGVTSLPRASHIPTYWSAQINVVGELLRARRGTLAAHREAVSTSSIPCASSSPDLKRPKNVSRATSQHHPAFFMSIPSSPILGILSRPQASSGSFAIQTRALHASQPQRLPAPAVILAAGALLKASSSCIFQSVC